MLYIVFSFQCPIKQPVLSIKDLLIFMKGSLAKVFGELFPRILLSEHLMRFHLKESLNTSSLMCLSTLYSVSADNADHVGPVEI